MENNSLFNGKDDNIAIEAIKKGLDLRSNTKEGKTFWDDFMRVTGNAKALSYLLFGNGNHEIEIMKWRNRVNKFYKQVLADRKHDVENRNKKNKIMHTGDDLNSDQQQDNINQSPSNQPPPNQPPPNQI